MKKKPCVNLSAKNIVFDQDDLMKKVILFDPNKMTVNLSVREDGKNNIIETLPYAHLPKAIKKLVK